MKLIDGGANKEDATKMRKCNEAIIQFHNSQEHPSVKNLVMKVYEVQQYHNIVKILMEYIDGKELAEYLNQ